MTEKKSVVWNRRPVRVTLSVCLIAVGVYALIPFVLSVTSSRSVINTTVLPMTSPINGFVHGAPQEAGRWIERDELLFTVANENQNRSFLNELLTERRTLAQRIDAFTVQAEDLQQLMTQLGVNVYQYQRFTSDRIEHEIARLEADRAARQAALSSVRSNLSRQQQLNDNGYARDVEVEDLTFQVQGLEAEISSIAAQVRVLEADQAGLRAGTFVGIGRNDVPYSMQRADEIRILLADIAARLSEDRTRIAEIDREILIEQEQLARTERFEVRSPMPGVLWRSYIYPGAAVPSENELIVIADCETLFVDAAVSNRSVNTVMPGMQVSVRLVGSSMQFDGIVSNVYGGASMLALDRTQAAVLIDVEASEIVARIAIDISELPQLRENACYIGRQVSVEFPKQTMSFLRDMF
ncbi:HlyD family efflux transporter periplasmic adaptor subunit [Yoonia vestfoldensis]|nr:HlyD family efflux transporter periplasmic adaptor subunit [Yoonia vestfoldensis]